MDRRTFLKGMALAPIAAACVPFVAEAAKPAAIKIDKLIVPPKLQPWQEQMLERLMTDGRATVVLPPRHGKTEALAYMDSMGFAPVKREGGVVVYDRVES